ncbi:MAG TPA: hypothetical protein VLK65_00475 [Vicinamibacteria bacterium]|nr:hypothetical protein [Vicinamibacteria bacterium]
MANLTGNVLVQQIDGGPPVNRTEGLNGGCQRPSWSPDGRNIAFLCHQREGSAYYVMSALGGEARKVMNTFSRMLPSTPQWLGGAAELAGISE